MTSTEPRATNVSQPLLEIPTRPAWTVEPSYNGIVAVIPVVGKGPNGDIRAMLRIQCPTPMNDVTNIEFVVSETDQLSEFDFNSFEGPYAPNLTKKLVEFKIHSDARTDKWLAKVHGSYVETDSFRFGPSADNQPDRTDEIAQKLANGNVSLTVIVHDSRDWNRTLQATFPPIDLNSETASRLNGCNKKHGTKT